MGQLSRQQIVNCVNQISGLFNSHPSQEALEKGITTLEKMKDSRDAMICLAMKGIDEIYRRGKEQDSNFVNGFLSVVSQLDPTKFPDINQLRLEAEQRLISNDYPGNNPIPENSKLIYDTLLKILPKLAAAGLDVALDGPAIGYIMSGYNLTKYFREIQIDVNEKDIPQLKSIIDNLDGFGFSDKRFANNRTLNQKTMKSRGEDLALSAEHSQTDFRIEFVPFTREQDGSIVYKDYCTDRNLPTVVETVIGPQKAPVDMPVQTINIMGTPFRCRGLASIYKNLDNALSNRSIRNDFESKINPEMLRQFMAIQDQIVIKDAIQPTQTQEQQFSQNRG